MSTARSRVRVELARERLVELDRGLAVGLEALALRVLQVVKPPDATPYGEGLVDRGGFISYVDGKRVGGDPEVKKPKGFLVRGKGASVAVGFGFPGRFQEMGTVNQPAHPFLTPAVMSVVGNEGVVVSALKTALAGVLAKKGRRALRYSLK